MNKHAPKKNKKKKKNANQSYKVKGELLLNKETLDVIF